MKNKSNLSPLLNHLGNTSNLSSAEAEKLVAEVIAYFSETPESFVQRRHTELQQIDGYSNARIYRRIEEELAELVFAAPELSQRQIRRMIYG
ncbi:MAG: hypothetical protein ACI92E_003242 [Oceanicoccus sp.]|jgi:hypothetical protein